MKQISHRHVIIAGIALLLLTGCTSRESATQETDTTGRATEAGAAVKEEDPSAPASPTADASGTVNIGKQDVSAPAVMPATPPAALTPPRAPDPTSRPRKALDKLSRSGPVPVLPREEAEREHNTESYGKITEGRFLDTVGNPLSTFSIDVDTASYANVRRFLRQGQRPYPDAVRVEELINYFTYDYPEPDGDDPFSYTTELSDCLWAPDHKLLHIGLQAKKLALEDLPPNDLVFLLDVSGSMNSPNKLPLLVSAFKLLAGELREQDRVAIVVYAGAAGLVLPSTPGSDTAAILQALDGLRAGGSTAGGAGIKLAYQVAAEHATQGVNSRVILATDGDFNVGASSDAEMVRLIEEKRGEGVFLTVLGFGTGNIKDSKMEQLADKGNGNYAYIDSLMEARKVLVSEMGGTLVTVAKDVKVQVEFNPTRVKSYRLVGYENRMLAKEDFADDAKDAGELGAGHTVTALYEIVPADGTVSAESLRYQKTATKPGAAASDELAFLKLRYKEPDGDTSKLVTRPIADTPVKLSASSDNFKFSAAVAAWAMLLRESEHKGNTSFDQVEELAHDAIGQDPKGYRKEFIELVRLSAAL